MIKPRIHQHELIQFHEKHRYLGTLAWHGMGLGKTFSALTIARNLLASLRAEGVQAPKFLVVCPKSASVTWLAECREKTPDIYRDQLILPYSQLDKAARFVNYYDIRFVIFDESHYLKTPDNERGDLVVELFTLLHNSTGGFKRGRIILLSGTPMLNNAGELYTSWAICAADSLMTAVARFKDPDRYKKWLKTFAKKKENVWYEGNDKKIGSEYKGVDNENQLNQLLLPFTHYRRVSDCIDLPAKQEIPIDLNLPDDKLLQDADIERPEAYMAFVAKLAEAKTPHMLEWIRTFIQTSNEQLVVFAMHRHPLDEIKKIFKDKVVMVTGDESGAERRANVTRFQQGKVRIIALTFGAGSEALNLQNAYISLYHGYPWTDGRLKQAMARTYRSGQEKKSLHYFLTSGENDRRILRLVREKEEATTTVENALLSGYAGNIEPLEDLDFSLDTFV